MMPYHAVQIVQAERPQTVAERRAADARLGEMAAAVARLRPRTLPTGMLRRLLAGRSSRPMSKRPAAA